MTEITEVKGNSTIYKALPCRKVQNIPQLGEHNKEQMQEQHAPEVDRTHPIPSNDHQSPMTFLDDKLHVGKR